MKKIFLSLVCLLVCLLAMGEPISKEQAKKIASGYLDKNKGTNRSSMQADLADQMAVQAFQTDREGNPLMYVVNNAGGGYVIVSGDDRMRQVLGYSNSGRLDMDMMPDNMRYWLQGMCADMQKLIDAGYQYKNADDNLNQSTEVKPYIRTMLTSQWGQGEPYNNFCPLDGENQRTITGCLATAMAQVMYYHYKVRNANIPATPQADTEAYTTPRYLNIPALKVADYTIDWSQLIDKYNVKGVEPTEAQKENVAKLMAFCGAALYMNYGTDVSSAEYIYRLLRSSNTSASAQPHASCIAHHIPSSSGLT